MATIQYRKLNNPASTPTPEYKSDARYHSARWRRMRSLHLAVHPLCEDCLEENQTVPATVVDHHIPVRQGADFWDNTNYRSLCDMHHNKKRQSERGTINHADPNTHIHKKA